MTKRGTPVLARFDLQLAQYIMTKPPSIKSTRKRRVCQYLDVKIYVMSRRQDNFNWHIDMNLEIVFVMPLRVKQL